jgi:hypothetical protein
LLDFANTKTLDPRITFTRASTASFYDGKTVAFAEQNLFLQSQAIDESVWAKAASTTVSANDQIAPDGTTTADTLNLLVNTSRITQTITLAAGTYTASVFLKGTVGETTRIELGGTGNATQVTFTGDWQRVSVTATLSAGSNTFLIVRRTGSGDTAEVVQVWGAQLEQRSSVTDYTATTTAPITNYIPALQTAASGVARFEHNPVTGESLGLEIEEQRINLVLRSEEFDNASWTKTDSSITANTIISPDGTLTGDKLVENTSNSSHLVGQSVSITSGVSYTFTAYVKAAERSALRIFFASAGFGSNLVANFNLATGAWHTSSPAPSAGLTLGVNNVGNGWYRISATATATATASTLFRIYLLDIVTSSGVYEGNGYSGIYIWGAQLEAGAFPTSYIPTVASQVTRSADAATITGTNFSSWFNNNEGTLYGDAITNAVSGYPGIASLFDSINNAITLGKTGGTTRTWANILTNAASQASVDSSAYGTGSAGVIAYKVNDVAISAGGTPSTDTLALIPVVSLLRIGLDYSTIRLNGTIKKIAYYPKRLTNAELQGMTTV